MNGHALLTAKPVKSGGFVSRLRFSGHFVKWFRVRLEFDANQDVFSRPRPDTDRPTNGDYDS